MWFTNATRYWKCLNFTEKPQFWLSFLTFSFVCFSVLPVVRVSGTEVTSGSTDCPLLCEHGYRLEWDGSLACECAHPGTTAPVIHVTDAASPTTHAQCQAFSCHKTCAFGYRLTRLGCPRCKCNRCPVFECTKTCSHGFVSNSHDCRICRCVGKIMQSLKCISQTHKRWANIPVNTKHLYNIYTTSAQRRRRWADVV